MSALLSKAPLMFVLFLAFIGTYTELGADLSSDFSRFARNDMYFLDSLLFKRAKVYTQSAIFHATANNTEIKEEVIPARPAGAGG